MPIPASNRLNKEIGSTYPRKERRHPPKFAKKLIPKTPIRYEMDMPATTHPIAPGLFSRGKFSPTSVVVIGE